MHTWKQLLPNKHNIAAMRAVSMISSCDASPFECHHNFILQCNAQLKTADTYQTLQLWREQCQCSHYVMPHHFSAITIPICDVMHNWKQLIQTQSKSSCDESSVNALVVWCLTIWVPSQLQSAMSCKSENNQFQHNQNLAAMRAASMLSSCDASFECHHN